MTDDLDTNRESGKTLKICKIVLVHYSVAGLIPIIFLLIGAFTLNLTSIPPAARLATSLLLLILFDWIFARLSLKMIYRTLVPTNPLAILSLSSILLGATVFFSMIWALEILQHNLPAYAKPSDFHLDLIQPLQVIAMILAPFIFASLVQMRVHHRSNQKSNA